LIGRKPLNLIVGWRGRFLFFVVPHQFSQVIGEWPENQILIPHWTYFHCPDTTLLNDRAKSCMLGMPVMVGLVSWHDCIHCAVATIGNDLNLVLNKALLEASKNGHSTVIVMAKA